MDGLNTFISRDFPFSLRFCYPDRFYDDELRTPFRWPSTDSVSGGKALGALAPSAYTADQTREEARVLHENGRGIRGKVLDPIEPYSVLVFFSVSVFFSSRPLNISNP